MTDYKSTIAELHYLADWAKHHLDKAKIAREAADAIEALQGECAEHKENAIRNARIAVSIRAALDALQAKLDAMGKGEPVGYVGAGYLTLGEGRISEYATDVYKVPVYAAPKALAPLTDDLKRAMWIAATIELPSQENCYLRGIADAERHHGITKGTP